MMIILTYIETINPINNLFGVITKTILNGGMNQ